MPVPISVYNNLTRSKDPFKPLVEGKVRFYSCGPTTYDFLHVGNARALVVGDLFHRIFKALGYEVTFVRNFTDVDDKIINRANELGTDPIEHAALYVKECLQDMQSLGMQPATHTPKVTETIPEIIQMIQEIIEKGFGYIVDGEVLFHVPAFKEYGKLSKKDLESLEYGRRVEVEQHKKHASDFVLWKPAKEGEPCWDSPWGQGRPGWHIECSAMARKFLGKNIDLHHGGVDLIFPHHENEIAQSEAANGCPFSNNWCHNEFLNFGSEKMSKSLGNVVSIRKFCETYGGEVLRQILLSAHYRSKMEWGEEAIERAITELERIHQFIIRFEAAKPKALAAGEIDPELENIIEKMQKELANDFNVPGAMAYFFATIRKMNKNYLDSQSKLTLNQNIVKQVDAIIDFIAQATGCVFSTPKALLERLNRARGLLKGNNERLSAEAIEEFIRQREQARQDKDWQRSDAIRDELKTKGIELKDGPDGSTSWRYI